MKIVVLKFGGTSVGSIEKIKNVSNIIQNYKKKGNKVIVVSSAMSGVTNDLIKKSKKISKSFSDAEYDVLVSSGEQIACSLIAGRLIDKGYKSRSWLAWQVPILTEGLHKNSRINQINKTKSTDVDGTIPKGTSEYQRGTTEERTCELVLMDGVTKSHP